MFHVKHSDEIYDVIVVGGGHAGVDAAHAAMRMGARTALVTHRFDRIGEMSCNPAMGGLGKSHLMREVDALDGLIARCADKAGIQYRLLNRSRGPAVRGPRAQCDRDLYRKAMQNEIAASDLIVIEGEVSTLIVANRVVSGVTLSDGRVLTCGAVVLTTGTFLRGVMHIGDQQTAGGRVGDAAAVPLADQIREGGFRVGRLKTGTPARLDGSTIAYERLEEQPGDAVPEPLSYLTDKLPAPQVSCFVTQTTPEAHEIIRANLSKSAMHAGYIEGVGPRYCPSIEDKVVRFAEKTGHNVFLEPETVDGAVVYPNGISTSLPADVQSAFIRCMPGLANVRIVRPGYAIEYDFVDPTELSPDLQTKRWAGLFLAGQINGTTGYEEAAALGVFAGMNAARCASGAAPVTFSRSEAYIGVLVDDLVTRGVTEPYRMFTSRAEYRLRLRVDNADERLTAKGRELGLVQDERWARYQLDQDGLTAVRSRLKERSVSPREAEALDVKINKDGVKRSLYDLLSYPGVTFELLERMDGELASVSERHKARLEAETTYSGYLNRQDREIALLRAEDSRSLPDDLDIAGIPSLSAEVREKLLKIRPSSLGQASRIEGMTPSALAILASYAQGSRRSGGPSEHSGGSDNHDE